MSKEKKINNENTIRNVVGYYFRTVWKFSPIIFLLYFVEICIGLIQPLITTVVPKFIIDELMGERDVRKIIIYVVIIVFGYEVFGFVLNVTRCKKTKCIDAITRHFNALFSEKAMSMDFHYTENPELLNMAEQVKSGMGYAGGPTALLDCICAIITGALLVVESGIIFMTGSSLIIVIMLIAIVLHIILTRAINNVEIIYYQKRAAFDRSFAYILWQLSNYRFGKEIRLYRAQDMMLDKADYYNGQLSGQMKAQSNSVVKLTSLDTVVSLLQTGTVYFYLGVQVIRKTIGYGDFTMYLSAVTNFMGGIQSAFYNFQMIFNKCFYLGQFVKFMNYPNMMDTGEMVPKESADHTIEFRNVYYKYSGTDKYALENVSLKINSGEHISIVGMNGAGKTTFIKLLCRLYDVERGEILLDGVNIKEYDYKEYTKLFSVVFQDFKLFSFSLNENIACDEDNIDVSKVEAQLKRVGILDKFNELERKTDTNLFKDFDEAGIEPSGGEQQKIAIARALYRSAPIVILDEPTAALDPIAEMEVYTHFNELVQNKTALFISHRLSSCRFSDRVVVFKDGKIIEAGTHNQLMEVINGEYATMFSVQATYYQ